MNLSNIPKFVVNLERRPDRLEHIKKEMEYIGWDFELFKAIDLNNHGGCSLSHFEILKLAKDSIYPGSEKEPMHKKLKSNIVRTYPFKTARRMCNLYGPELRFMYRPYT